MQLSVSEILGKVSEMQTKREKVDWLQKNDSLAIRSILKAMYDPTLKCLLPRGAPPYKPSQYPDDQGMLYANVRRLPYFYEGKGSPLNPTNRERIFIQLLESVNKDDALLLINMKDKKPVEGLTVNTINRAYPNLITEES